MDNAYGALGDSPGLEHTRVAAGTEANNSQLALGSDFNGNAREGESPAQGKARSILICNQMNLNSSSQNDVLPFETRESQ